MNVSILKNFARLFARTRNCRESAMGVGFDWNDAVLKGEELLANKNVRKQLEKIDREDKQSLCYVKAGLTRLAFGAVNDAVALVFDDDVTYEKVIKADLFNLAEIKKIKGGGIEMKFFDRQKAMEKLVEFDPNLKEESDAEKFIKAVYSGSSDIPEEVEEDA